MNSHRGLISGAALVAAAALACAPAGAQGSSLLSGYGGPGQGSQALLGSTLIGGGGGGGSSSAGGSTGSGGSVGSLAVAPAHGEGTTSGRRTGGSDGHAAPAGQVPGRDTGRAAALRFHETGAGSSTLGLSALDLVFILAVLAGLVLIALLMRGATRGARPGAPD